ncbi:MAG: DUF1624 domain-containing protein [Acidobacteriia bacterium]|nr:DUF1624 domain-containing protein [Terriglobia bacterium]
MASPGARLASLDAFRGFTISSMILVNNAGSFPEAYAQLRHSSWHGWTFTDIVFPFFLWIVGVSLTFSFAKRKDEGADRGKLMLHTLRRSALIFGLGLLLNGLPYFQLDTIRIPGVLQRIAVCYLIAAAIFLYTSVRGQALFIPGLMLAYTALMHPEGYEKGSNFAAYFDSLFLSGHMYSVTKVWDPEGIISTIPAIATTLFGVLTGHLLRSSLSEKEKTAWMLFSGNFLVQAGFVCDRFQPINKNLWTCSYSLLMAGLALVVFGCFYFLIDVKGHARWSRPFQIYGMNAITVYVLAGVLDRMLGLWKIGATTADMLLYERVFLPMASPINASLLYALSMVLLLYGAAWLMHRRGWFPRF